MVEAVPRSALSCIRSDVAGAFRPKRFYPGVAAGVLAFNALLFVAFFFASGKSAQVRPYREVDRLAVRIVLQPATMTPQPPSVSAEPRRAPFRRRQQTAQHPKGGGAAAPAPLQQPQAASNFVGEKTEVPPPPAVVEGPASLTIDIRRANEASHGAVTRLAQRARAPLNSDRVTKEDRLKQGMDAASIPDCLRPDALKHAPIHLGGLLDLPVLAYVAMNGKCKQ